MSRIGSSMMMLSSAVRQGQFSPIRPQTHSIMKIQTFLYIDLYAEIYGVSFCCWSTGSCRWIVCTPVICLLSLIVYPWWLDGFVKDEITFLWYLLGIAEKLQLKNILTLLFQTIHMWVLMESAENIWGIIIIMSVKAYEKKRYANSRTQYFLYSVSQLKVCTIRIFLRVSLPT